MLNLLKNKNNNIKLNESINNINKHFPSAVREWNNSIYVYNKNSIKLIPSVTKYTMNIIKGYFSFYNKQLEKKLRTKKLLLRFRRLSSNRIYLSNGEFKHTNNNVLINIYIFNRQIHNYLYKMKIIYLKNFLKNRFLKFKIVKRLKHINNKCLNKIKSLNKNKYLLINTLNNLKKNKNYKISTFNNLSDYTKLLYKKLLNLTMKKLRLYFLYKQLVQINRSKFSYTYLRLLKKQLEYIYNKNVEFNIINLNRFYLNSDILFESMKLKLRRNKRKMRKLLNKLKDKVKTNERKISLFYKPLNVNVIEKINNEKLLNKSIFNELKYKHITGFRLEARGRLTRRYTASRSVYKLKYKGNLLNLDSSFRGLSSVILRGNLNPNLQYTKLHSKTRIGSFGIKGWVSGN